MKILQKLAIATIVSLMGTTLVYAEAPMEGQRMHHQMKSKKQSMKNILQKLNLTKEQKKALRADRAEMRKAMHERKKNRKNIAQFVTVNGVDRDAMVKMATKRAVDIANIRADIIEKTLKILTPEQRTKFVSLLKERR